MQKLFLPAAVGIGISIMLTGCQKTNVMGERGYIPAPVDDANVTAPAVTPQTVTPQPAAAPKPLYEPMTDAVPTGGVDSAAAAPKAPASAGKYVVKSGDFPARIARKCHVSVSALMAANNLTEESARKLKVGQVLVIPAAKTAPKSAVKNAVQDKKAAAPAASDGKYVVRPGDSPAKIAKRFHVSVSALMAANNLNETSAKSLQVGQKLVIPGKGHTAATVAQTQARQTPAQQTVAPAQEAAAPAQETAAAPAQETAAAPVADGSSSADDAVDAVEITTDTTLAEFAAQNNIPVEKLRSINEGKDKLHKGELLFIPKK